MAVFIFFLIIALLVVFLVIRIRFALFGRALVREFERCNVVVDGKKGTGKDLVFQYVINKRKQHYYSNIKYGHDGTLITLEDVSCAPNTYDDFIQGAVHVIPRRFYEGEDIYISDGGIFLPSYMDTPLYRHYPSAPIFYALSRHLANNNIHVNIQNTGRLWKGLREQADSFVHVCGNVKLFGRIFVKLYIYDNLQAACKVVRPVKRRMFNKFDRTQKDIYEAENGVIKSGWICIKKKDIVYDTRAFERYIYGDSPRLERPKRKSIVSRLVCKVKGWIEVRSKRKEVEKDESTRKGD